MLIDFLILTQKILVRWINPAVLPTRFPGRPFANVECCPCSLSWVVSLKLLYFNFCDSVRPRWAPTASATKNNQCWFYIVEYVDITLEHFRISASCLAMWNAEASRAAHVIWIKLVAWAVSEASRIKILMKLTQLKSQWVFFVEEF